MNSCLNLLFTDNFSYPDSSNVRHRLLPHCEEVHGVPARGGDDHDHVCDAEHDNADTVGEGEE